MTTITMTTHVTFQVDNVYYCDISQRLSIFLVANTPASLISYPLLMPAQRRNGEVYVDFSTLQLTDHNMWIQKFNYPFDEMKAFIKAALIKYNLPKEN